MNLIIHQAMTDLRAQRWLVAAWAAMLAAACIVETLTLDDALALPLLALAAGRVVLGWVLAIRIVHADPLEGTNAFWLTRPLSRPMLLAAKGGLILVLLLGVPGAVAAVDFAVNGIAGRALLGVLAQWLLVEAVLLLPIVLAATLTRDVARMVLTVLAWLAAWWVLQRACWTLSNLPAGMGADSAWQSSYVRAWLVVGVGSVALCAALIVRHYLTRRTVAVGLAALAGAAGIVAVASLWPVQLMVNDGPSRDEWRAQPARPAWRGADAVSVGVPEESLRLVNQAGRFGALIGDLRIDGLGDDVIVRSAGGRGTLRLLEGGQVVEQRRTSAWGVGFGLARLEDAASRQRFERMLGARLVDGYPGRLRGLHLVDATSGVFAGHTGGRADYDANLVFDADRVKAVAVMPLTAGAMAQVGDTSTTVLGVRWISRLTRWVVDVRRVVPRILSTGESLRVVPFLRNRKRGQAMILSGDSAGKTTRGLAATAIAATRVTYFPDYNVASNDLRIDAEWLRDADVVFVAFERLGSFTKHLTIPNFVLPKAQSPGP